MTQQDLVDRLDALRQAALSYYRTAFPCSEEPITDDVVKGDNVRLALTVGLVDGAFRIEILRGDDDGAAGLDLIATTEEAHPTIADALDAFEEEVA